MLTVFVKNVHDLENLWNNKKSIQILSQRYKWRQADENICVFTSRIYYKSDKQKSGTLSVALIFIYGICCRHLWKVRGKSVPGQSVLPAGVEMSSLKKTVADDWPLSPFQKDRGWSLL